jgi:plastocyanin domain-containing protein
MLSSKIIIAAITSLGLKIGIATNNTVAQIHDLPHPSATTEFKRIDRSLWLKGAVTATGSILIGLELWWFLGSKPKSRSAQLHEGIQAVKIKD